MSAPSPQQGLLGLMIYSARVWGPEAMPALREALLRLTGEMFSGVDLTVYHAITEIVERGIPTGPGELMAQDKEITLEVLGQYQKFERVYASLEGAVTAVVAKHDIVRVQQALTAALAATEKGDLGLARAL